MLVGIAALAAAILGAALGSSHDGRTSGSAGRPALAPGGPGVQKASRDSALVCADQEGGSIRIVRFGAPGVAPPQIRSTAAARRASVQTARDLRLYGINVNLAPVADVAAGAGPVMRSRAYAGGTTAVARRVAAVVRAHGERRVAATVKHFPGLGAATANTDFRVAYVLRSRGAIARRDLPPFRAAIRAGVPLVMASHALYPALDRTRIASQSRAVLVGLLRSRLGFRGAVITDSLEAKAVLSRSSVATAAVLSLRAGADIALLTGRGSFRPVYFRLLREARRSRAFRARLVDAAARVRLLKRSLGLKPPRGA